MAVVQDVISKKSIENVKLLTDEILKAVGALDKFAESREKIIATNAKIATSDDNVAKKKKQLTAVEVEAERIRNAQLATHAKLDKARSQAVLSLTKSQIELKKVNAAVKESITGEKASKEALKKTNTERKKAEKVIREQTAAAKSLENQRQKALAIIAKQQQAEKDLVAALNKEVKTEQDALNQNKALRKARRDINATTEDGARKIKTLNTRINANNAFLNKNADALTKAKNNIGRYKEGVIGAAKSLFGALGLIGGIAGLVKALGSAIRISIEFEASMAKVAAISGATAKEYRALRDQAKFLGEQTQKTAKDAAMLQIELSKIGFSPKQIINSTNAILELSIATGEDLAQSAKVAAGTLKAFNKDAEDTQELTDIMAKSFSSSALDLAKFETAASAAAPTLDEMGVSVERMTAQLSVLVDRNIDASTAGTGLRNVYLDLTKHGLTFEEAMNDINSASNKSARAFELFGKRGATVAVVLATNQEAADKLTRSYEMAGGSAARMAEIMIDNLKGDTDKATSAMQGLAINLGEQLTPALRSVTQGFTNIVSALSEFAKIGNAELLKEEQLNVNKLAIELTNANTTLTRRNEIYEELQDIAPEVIENIDFENVSIITLRGNLEKYNQTLIKKLALSETEVLKSEANIEASQALEERLKKEDNARSLLFRTQEKANKVGGEFKKTIDSIVLSSIPLEDKLKSAKVALADQISGFGKSQLEMAKFRTQTGLFNDAIRELTAAQRDEERATQKASDAVQAYTDRYNRIFGAGAVTTGVDEFIQGLIDIEDSLDDIEFDKKFSAFQEQSVKAILKSTEKSAKVMKKFRDDQTKEQAEASRFEVMLDKDVEAEDKSTDDEFLKRKKALDAELRGLNKSNASFAISQAKKAADEKIAIERMVKDAIVDLSAQGAQAITDILLEASSQRRDEELDLLDERREEDLEILDEQTQEDIAKVDEDLEKGVIKEEEASNRKKAILATSEAEKAVIEKESAAKIAAVKTKQAKAEKAAAIANIAINTAVAIIKSLALVPLPLGAPLVVLNAAAGAIQTAAVLATPIPKFFKGTNSAPGGIVSTAEKGQELIIPKGSDPFLTPHSQTYYSDLKGAEIVPNSQVKERLAEIGSKGQSFNFSDAGIVSELKKNTKAVKQNARSSIIDGMIITRQGGRIKKNHTKHINRMAE